MSDFYGQVTSSQDIFKKLLSKVPGFSGYIERDNRRAADKLMRETIANHFEAIWGRISAFQRELVSQGEIKWVDDVESAAIKLRQFIDRIRTTTYGYSGLFDAVKINEKELALIYAYDEAMLSLVDVMDRAVNHVEVSIGSDGFPASVRNLVSTAQQCVEMFDKRYEAFMGQITTPPESVEFVETSPVDTTPTEISSSDTPIIPETPESLDEPPTDSGSTPIVP
ncbi:MAG: hypothetical protein JW704_07240 [Anaerolineaceae bacterium]|nr:hypothetical protein [Anaerolineaceae bacterium]MBN2677177.1 hypothetical protein [Anaerolineaceae bacterium]